MLVVPDISEEMICPMQDGFFVDPHTSRNVIENFLTKLPNIHPSSALSALGAALRGALAALQRHGGQAVFLTSSGCTVGPGTHSAPNGTPLADEGNLYDTDKEKQLFTPKDSLWKDLGEELAETGVGVSMFVATSASGGMTSVDFGSIGEFSAFANEKGS